MKKKSFLYAILMMAVMFASCAKDPERHELQMLYPTTAYHYADETSDSLQFLTFTAGAPRPTRQSGLPLSDKVLVM